jgi:outer membrane immunogenic protein
MRILGIALAAAFSALATPGDALAQAQSQASNWSGPYAGLHGGVGAANVRGGSAKGGLVGGQIGVNTQADRLVLGVEGDITSSGFEHKGFNGGGQTFRQKWAATVRARAGVGFDQVLVYGTGGIATAQSQFSDIAGKKTDQAVGWAVGGGAEVKLTERVTARGELLHYSLGSGTFTTPIATYKLEQRTNVVRGGLNYRF